MLVPAHAHGEHVCFCTYCLCLYVVHVCVRFVFRSESERMYWEQMAKVVFPGCGQEKGVCVA